MKGFSLTQPWATAVAIGIKQWETRSWPTRFRGTIAIHAAKGLPGWARGFMEEEQLDGTLPQGELPRGAIICLANLTDCKTTTQVLPTIGEVEQDYGDYGPGRYAFKLENIRVLKTPIPCNGALSFWDVPPDIEQEIWKQLQDSSVSAGEAK